MIDMVHTEFNRCSFHIHSIDSRGELKLRANKNLAQIATYSFNIDRLNEIENELN